jgi:di/tricarboxylate transporter
VIIPADSDLIGKTVLGSSFRSRFGLSVIGLRRGVRPREQDVKDEELHVGDTLLVIGPWRSIRNLHATGGRDLVPLSLPAEYEELLPAPDKSAQALGVLLLVVGMMVTGVVPNVQAALIGCLMLGALGCVDFESAYRSIDWKTLVLIVGMLPFSLALQRTGGVDLASEALMNVTGGLGTRGVLAVLFATTALLGLFISNTATAVLMAPIALTVADRLEASPYPFAMIVALAASSAFMTPVSSPVNTLVVTPGGYRFGDFVRVGVPFTLVVMLVSVLMVPWLLPL